MGQFIFPKNEAFCNSPNVFFVHIETDSPKEPICHSLVALFIGVCLVFNGWIDDPQNVPMASACQHDLLLQ